MFVFQVESMAGHEFGRTRPEPNVGQTPAWKSLVAQDAVEEEIYKRHRTSKHGTGALLDRVYILRGIEERCHRVRIRSVEDRRSHRTGTPHICSPVTAPGADPANAGIEMVGPATLAVMSERILARRICRACLLAREAAGYWSIPGKPGVPPRAGILNTNGRDRWLSVIADWLAPRTIRERPWTDEETIEIDAQPCRNSGSRCDLAQPFDLAHERAGRGDVPDANGYSWSVMPRIAFRRPAVSA